MDNKNLIEVGQTDFVDASAYGALMLTFLAQLAYPFMQFATSPQLNGKDPACD